MPSDNTLYLVSVVATAWAVTFALRALPFLIFAGRNRPLPRAVERFGALVSPVIIAGLIVYSYTGLEWRTAWPYVAGALTVGLQLWKGNPLSSILAGTAVYMMLLAATGCAAVPVEHLESKASRPLVRVTTRGIRFQGQPVAPDEVVKLLEKNGVPKDQTLHVLVDEDFDDARALWVFQHNYLNRGGYTKALMMVGARRTLSGDARLKESETDGKVIPYPQLYTTP
ncbi:MAG: AzlD domain-containing protein [Kiritimatiellae bacterium]|nr:AzlD domain-containing protein [Kiritimatiellia bacterium]